MKCECGSGRYVFSVLACLGNMICLLGRDTMRLAILPMQEELSLSPGDVSHVLGGYSYGMVVTMLLGGPLADTLGGKWVLVLVTLLSSLCTLLVPLLAPLSLPALVCVQVVSGLGGGLVVPALSSMIARWEPVSETGKLATVIYTGSQLSMVFSSIFTGYVSHAYNWQLAFYLIGSIPLLWTIPWLLLVQDDPSKSRLTSEREREMLREETMSSKFRPRLRNIPILRIISSPAVLAVIAANIGVCWATSHTSFLLPQYLDSSLGLPLHHNSVISTLPYIGSSLLGLLSSYVYNCLLRWGLSRTTARKVCSSICLVGFALLTLPIPFIGHDTTSITILTTSAFALTGFNLVGAWTNPQDIAPNFVGTIMGVMGLFSYLTGSFVPHTTTIMASLVPEDQVWPALFMLVASVAVLSNGVFILLGTANTQAWNKIEECDSREILHIHIEDIEDNVNKKLLL